MTREQFLSQYTGEWSAIRRALVWLGFWLARAGISFSDGFMYHPANTVLPDGREARFGVYKGSAYALIGEYATPQEALAQCRIQGMPLATFSKMNRQNCLGRTKVENDSSFPERGSCFLQQINAYYTISR